MQADAFSAARFWDGRVERRLTMTSCDLSHVDAAAFRSLPRLRSLYLADNPRLPRDTLLAAVRRLVALRQLDVSASSLFRRTFDLAELFHLHSGAGGLRLEKLRAAGNGIRTVSGNLSTAVVVSTLRSLDLSDNDMSTLGGGLSLLRRLERLGVKGNRLTDIDGGALTELDRLTTVDLSYNRLEKLNDDVLWPLTRLRHLNLAGNRLRTLVSAALPPGVEFLSVRDNRLVDVSFLAGLPHLRSVDVSGNRLAFLDANLFSRHVGSLISANFSRNEISSIDNGAFAGVAFSVLDLAGNHLSRLSLYGATAVDVLRADDNVIVDVDEGLFHVTRDLHLAGNRLSSLRTSCDYNDSSLDLLSSPAHVSSPDFRATTTQSTWSAQVLVLDVSDNPDLGPSLDWRHRHCHSLDGFDRLEILRARRVGIRRLPVALIGRLASLRVVDLAQNEIGGVSKEDLAAVERLHELDLTDNRLANLSVLAASLTWQRRSVVNLVGNPWRCSCRDVPVCRRLTTMLDTRPPHHRQHFIAPRCASLELPTSGNCVLEFCRNLVAVEDTNQTAFSCLHAQNLDEQEVVEDVAILRSLLIVLVVCVTLTLSVLLACRRLPHRNTGQRVSRVIAGTARRNGYHIVGAGETAMDFTEIQ